MARHSINENLPKDEDDKNVAVDIHINKDSTYRECVNSIVKHPPRSRPQRRQQVEGRSGLIANKLPSPLVYWYPEPRMKEGKELLCDGA